MLLNVVNKRAGEPQKLIVLLTIIIGRKMKKLLPLFIFIFFLVGCQSTGFLMAKAKVTMINEPYPAKDENANIEVYITTVPSEAYIEISQITCDDTENDWS